MKQKQWILALMLGGMLHWNADGAHLINVNFTAHLNASFTPKTGQAAIGQTGSDVWNVYSRDDGFGGFLWGGSLSNLKAADGSTTSVDLEVDNAAGAWVSGSTDPMMRSYLYPLSSDPNISIQIQQLPAGMYSFHVYAHGLTAAEYGVIGLQTSSMNHGSKTTANLDDWASGAWVEGRQFVVFRDVTVSAGETVQITSFPGGSVAVINGLQILSAAPLSPVLNITDHPQSTTVTAGSLATFFVTATGSSPLTYQWFFNNILIPGAVNGAYSVASAGSGHAGVYRVRVTNPVGSVTSDPALLTVLPPANAPPVIVQHPQSRTVNIGGPVTFNVVADSADPMTYQWFHNGQARAGATEPALSINRVLFADGGIYSVLVSNPSGSTSSGSAVLQVNMPPGFPVILDQPQDVVLSAGAAHTLSVTAVGTGTLNYQWFKDGIPITTPSTTPTYALVGATSSMAGRYTVRVRNELGSVISNTARVEVTNVLEIVNRPQSQIAPPGSMVTFSVSARGGVAPLSYQWAFRGNPIFNASGQRDHYTILNAQSSHEGAYTVQVRDAVGDVQYATAILMVGSAPPTGSPPVITSEPVPQTLEAGGFLYLKVGAAGYGPLSYEWFHNGRSRGFSDNPVYAGSQADAGLAGVWTVRVSNVYGSVTSLGTMVTVHDFLRFGEVTLPSTGTLGGTISFRVSALGGQMPYTYQWSFNGLQLPSSTGPDLILSNAQKDREGTYCVTIRDDDGSQISRCVSLTLFQRPVIVQQPTTQAVLVGMPVTLSVLAEGTGPLEYAWYRNGILVRRDANPTLTIASARLVDAGSYQVRVTNGGGTTVSTSVLVRVLSEPGIVVPPENLRVNPGDQAAFTVQAVGFPPLTYEWLHNGRLIPGANAPELLMRAVTAADAGTYTVRVRDGSGALVTAHATLNVNTPPRLVRQPAGATLPAGTPITLQVIAEGSPQLNYQWYRNGSPIAGATTAVLALASVQTPDRGNYTVLVSNPAGFVLSDVAVLNVGLPPLILPLPVLDRTVKAGEELRIEAAVGGTGPLAYSWKHNGAGIPGATSHLLIIPAARPADAGAYEITVRSPFGEASAVYALVHVEEHPSALRDGIPDTWRRQHFGEDFRTDSRAVATADPDGDLANNMQEFLDGTDPLIFEPNRAESPLLVIDPPGRTWGGVSVGESLEVRLTTRVPNGVIRYETGVLTPSRARPGEYNETAGPVTASSAAYQAPLLLFASAGVHDQVYVNDVPVSGHRASGPYFRRPLPASGSHLAFVETLAGAAPGTLAPGALQSPNGGAVGADGLVYFVDTGSHTVKRLNPATGEVKTIAGSGTAGHLDGPATAARFDTPLSLAVRSDGAILVADAGNHRIRLIQTDAARTVTTFAGSGERGYLDGPAGQARFDSPSDLVVTTTGDVFISEILNHTIRRIANGVVSTFAGNGARGYNDGMGNEAGFNQPTGLALDASGHLYVTEWNSHRVRKITPEGRVSVLAGNIFPGSADGVGARASFQRPDGIAVDTLGNVYVTENQGHSIRRISADGRVVRIAGRAAVGAEDGYGLNASFSSPGGICVDASGDLFVMDTGNYRLRKVTLLRPWLDPHSLGGTGTPDFGSEVSLEVTPEGVAPFTYQWLHDLVPIPGATGRSLQLRNLSPQDDGAYHVRIQNEAGAITAAVRELSVKTPPTVAERRLPDGYFPTRRLTVALVVKPSPLAVAYVIEERPPGRWQVEAVHGGTYDPVNHVVKFGPYFDTEERSVTYEVTPPVGTIGVQRFTGSVLVNDLAAETIGGASTLDSAARFHPADRAPADYRISASEISAYGAAWRLGADWPEPPSPIPIEYLTRAGALWRNGEIYFHDPLLPMPPLWWVTPPQAAGLLAFALGAEEIEGSQATRNLPEVFESALPFLVTVAVRPAGGTSSYAVEERVPEGWQITEASHRASFAPVPDTVRFGPFFDNEARDLTYTVSPNRPVPGPVSIEGVASFDGHNSAVLGATRMLPLTRSLGLTWTEQGRFELRIIGQEWMRYEIHASSDLIHWTPVGSAKNTGGVIVFDDPHTLSNDQRFYRPVLVGPAEP